MTNLNAVVLQGRLTKDAEADMKLSSGGTAFGSFSLAVEKSVKKGDEWENQTSFIDCKGFGKSYERAVKNMVKGSMCVIEGHLEQQTWEKDGQKHSKIVVIAERFYPTYQNNNSSDGQKKGGAQKFNTTPQNRNDEFQEDIPF